MTPVTIGSLFSGIGGFELGLEWAGLGPVVWQVEMSRYRRAVLAQHWPNARRYRDVRKVGAKQLARVDVMCGGFPCQDLSIAGRMEGLRGKRSGLWFEYLRIVRELRPRLVLVENVAILVRRGLGDILGGLADCGYDAEWSCIRAADVGAPHLRDRLFIVAYANDHREQQPEGIDGEEWQRARDSGEAVAYPDGPGCEKHGGAVAISPEQSPAQRGGDDVADASIERQRPRCVSPTEENERGRESHRGGQVQDVADARGLRRAAGRGDGPPAPDGTGPHGQPERCGWWDTEPDVGRVAHGVPARVERIAALGDAIVPQVAEVVGWKAQEILTRGWD